MSTTCQAPLSNPKVKMKLWPVSPSTTGLRHRVALGPIAAAAVPGAARDPEGEDEALARLAVDQRDQVLVRAGDDRRRGRGLRLADHLPQVDQLVGDDLRQVLLVDLLRLRDLRLAGALRDEVAAAVVGVLEDGDVHLPAAGPRPRLRRKE